MSGVLAGKIGIVTGASTGIGYDTALRLAEEGATLTLAARSLDKCEMLAAEIARRGGAAHAVAVDVTDAAGMEALVEAVEARHGRLDFAFNNAGTLLGASPLHETPLTRYHAHMATNLDGVFYSLRAQIPALIRSGGGSIVVTSAGSGVRARPMVGDYSASKMGAIGLCHSAAQEVGRHGIRINVVAPGYIATEAWTTMLGSSAAQLASKVPLPRIGTGAEVADAVLWLLSDLARYTTGAVIPVDGGLLTV